MENNNLLNVQINNTYTPTGKLSNKFEGIVTHSGLNTNKRIVDTDIERLKQRLEAIAAQCETEWQCQNLNTDRLEEIEYLNNGILNELADNSFEFDWDSYKDFTQFDEPQPEEIEEPPDINDIPPKPTFIDTFFYNRAVKKTQSGNKINFIESFFQTRVNALIEKQHENYVKATDNWKNKKTGYEKLLSEWQAKKEEYKKNKIAFNIQIDNFKESYLRKEKSGVEFFAQSVLNKSSYKVNYARLIECEFNEDEFTLIVNYQLPRIDDISKVKKYKYVKATNEITSMMLSESEYNRLYESVIYQITLRSIAEIFNYDISNAIKQIVFNGWVDRLNEGTGNVETLCILSISTTKEAFSKINLTMIEPKVCFRTLKGVSASSLNTTTAINPIMQLSRDDSRFVDSIDIAQNITEGQNLASMDWEEFEHLVRQIFAHEFEQEGGEVKVTQSSRDKGVDAIVFYDDLIKGGKIIIQAKRYTNTVGVESVRALYGVMQDEGAMKGIMITTSDYGSDAYSFVKDKPITLMSGGHLLALLQKHGYKGHININEAKSQMK